MLLTNGVSTSIPNCGQIINMPGPLALVLSMKKTNDQKVGNMEIAQQYFI